LPAASNEFRLVGAGPVVVLRRLLPGLIVLRHEASRRKDFQTLQFRLGT
jgi:hypothetical protein